MSTADEFTTRLAQALGSDRVVPLDVPASGGPLEFLHLRSLVYRVQGREERQVEHRVHLSETSWRELEDLAAELSKEGSDISPAELARWLLERGVDALRASRRKTG